MLHIRNIEIITVLSIDAGTTKLLEITGCTVAQNALIRFTSIKRMYGSFFNFMHQMEDKKNNCSKIKEIYKTGVTLTPL